MTRTDLLFNRRRAVLVGSGISSYQNPVRYRNDLAAFYALLRGHYSLSKSDIQVLYSNGGFHLMGPDHIDTTLADRNNVHAALQRCSSLGSDDLLIILFSGHGTSGQHTYRLWNGESIRPSQVASRIPDDPYLLGIFGHCFSADMFAALEKRERSVLVAASKTFSEALPPDYAYNSFLYHMTSALRLKTPSGYPADADNNNDGHVDIREAYEFARRMTKRYTKDDPDMLDTESEHFNRPELASRLSIGGLL